MPRHLHLLGHAWPLRVQRRRGAKRVTLRVSSTGRITLTLPRWMGVRRIEALLSEATPWLCEQLEAVRAARPADPIPSEIHLEAVGERRMIQRDPARLRLHDDGIRLWLPNESSVAVKALRNWLKAQGRRYYPPRLETLAIRHGFTYQRLTIRHQRSRWGSCSSRGEISLNCAALLLQPKALEHLMIHELCHTVEPHHGPAFWARVARCDPDWRHWNAYLDEAMGRLPHWARPD